MNSTFGTYGSRKMSNILKRVIPNSQILEITLNRPKVLNALSTEMCGSIITTLQKDINDQESKIRAFILKGSGGKAFCAGGDVKSLWQEVQSMQKAGVQELGSGKPGSQHADFFRTEYTMNYLLHSSVKPQISFWDGVVMGGGVGVSVLGEFRVATEKTLFAMPETAIGLIPDVASSAWLPHLPNGFGLFIGLTGSRLQAADLLRTNIATHFVKSSRLEELESALTVELPEDPADSRKKIQAILDDFEDQPDPTRAVLIPHADIISRCFGAASSVEEVLSLLQGQLAASDRNASEKEFIENTIKSLTTVSPLSLKLTFAQLSRGRDLDLKACLQMEFRVILRCMRDGDFVEGVRALLVDKDQRPLWKGTLAQISDADIDPFFDSLGEYELHLDDL